MALNVSAVAPSFGLEVHYLDIEKDPELERKYVFEIPVLLLDGVEVARYRATVEELRTSLERLVGRAP